MAENIIMNKSNMIPIFPKFKKLEWTDRQEVEEFTKDFPPYSEFNFSSIWAWDTDKTMRLSMINGNLALLANDCATGKNYLSFIGKLHLEETVSELIDLSMENSEMGILKFIPEEVAKKITDSHFEVILDEANCDHVIPIASSINLDECQKSFRQNCNQFLRNYSEDIQITFESLNLMDKSKLTELFIRWAENKQIDYLEFAEFKAFEKYIELKEDNIKVLSIHDKEKIVGFQIVEIISEEYATCEFFKADTNYKGIYQFIEWKTCEFLHQQNIKYLNLQIDLGIKGLRKSKNKANPKFLLNSFIIQNKA